MKIKLKSLVLYNIIFYNGIGFLELSVLYEKDYLSIVGVILILLSSIVYSIIDNLFLVCKSKRGYKIKNIDLMIKVLVIILCSFKSNYITIQYISILMLFFVNVPIVIIMRKHINEWIDAKKADEQREFFKEKLKDNKLMNRVVANLFLGVVYLAFSDGKFGIVIGTVIYLFVSVFLIYYFYNNYYKNISIFFILMGSIVLSMFFKLFGIELLAYLFVSFQAMLPILLLNKVKF